MQTYSLASQQRQGRWRHPAHPANPTQRPLPTCTACSPRPALLLDRRRRQGWRSPGRRRSGQQLPVLPLAAAPAAPRGGATSPAGRQLVGGQAAARGAAGCSEKG